MKPKILLYCLLANALWFIMFSPLTTGRINFWLVMTMTALVLLLVGLYESRQSWNSLYKFELKWLWIGIGAAVLLYFVFFIGKLFSHLLFDFAEKQIDNIYLIRTRGEKWLIGTLLFFIIGPAEEIFWRGFIQWKLSLRFGDFHGFVFASLLYAGVHIWSLNFMLFMASMVCGVFWGWMYYKYKSIVPGIISHALWDVLIFVLLPVQ